MWVTPGLKIQRCGYLEPRDFPGNHSMIWADIAYDDALGHNPPMPKSPDARRLKLQYPDVVHKYLSRYRRLILEHDLERRQFALEASTQYGVPLSPGQIQEAEALDVIRTKCMLRAEKKCRKLRMGRVDFSPTVAQCLKRIAFWDVAISRKYLLEQDSRRGHQMRHKPKVDSRGSGVVGKKRQASTTQQPTYL